jgi:hypothetical protein
MIRAFALCLALSGCVASPAPVVVDVGCLTYGQQRATMPPLGLGAVDRWAAETDSAMTGACT